MMAACERTAGEHISMRLMAALEAGQAAGGDRRGMQSAAMLIVKKEGGVRLHNDLVLRLPVNDNPEPIMELRRLVERPRGSAGGSRCAAGPTPRVRRGLHPTRAGGATGRCRPAHGMLPDVAMCH
jgi:hypothetical protein